MENLQCPQQANTMTEPLPEMSVTTKIAHQFSHKKWQDHEKGECCLQQLEQDLEEGLVMREASCADPASGLGCIHTKAERFVMADGPPSVLSCGKIHPLTVDSMHQAQPSSQEEGAVVEDPIVINSLNSPAPGLSKGASVWRSYESCPESLSFGSTGKVSSVFADSEPVSLHTLAEGRSQKILEDVVSVPPKLPGSTRLLGPNLEAGWRKRWKVLNRISQLQHKCKKRLKRQPAIYRKSRCHGNSGVVAELTSSGLLIWNEKYDQLQHTVLKCGAQQEMFSLSRSSDLQ